MSGNQKLKTLTLLLKLHQSYEHENNDTVAVSHKPNEELLTIQKLMETLFHSNKVS